VRFSLALLAAASAWGQIVISQVYGGGGNTGATWKNDFIELFNRGAAPLDLSGWTVEYAPAASGDWAPTRLSGVLEPGQYFLVQQAAGAGGTQDLPAPDATGTTAMSATAARVRLRSADGATVDLVGYGAASESEGHPAPQLSNTMAALRRSGGCVDTDDNAADFQTGPPNPRHTASPRNSCQDVTPPPPPSVVSISEIQGRGERSPLAGRRVTTSGVVTALKRNGFFLQTFLQGEDDGDDATSEGVFVFTSSTPPVSRESAVQVTGTVTEFGTPPLTELTDPVIEFLARRPSLPQPVRLRPGDWNLERYEGMRVEAPPLTVVGPTTSNGVFYGVLSGPRPAREPGRDWDNNPERLRIDSDEQPGTRALEVAAGAVVSGLAGPLDFGFRTWTILPDPGAPLTVTGAPAARPVPPAAPDEFTVASLNLQRFLAGEPNRLSKAALLIRNVLGLPDIVGVQEADNLAALQALADRLGYRAYLEEGNDPSGIDVGFLVKPAVRVLEVRQEGKSDPVNDRPPLVLRATVGPSAFPITVIVNHLRSLTDIEDPRVQDKRRAQAEFLTGLIRARQADNLIVVGDFNSFQFDDGYVDVIGILKNAGLPNVTEALPLDQNYSYVFDGNTQTLDHILVSRGLAGRVSRIVYGRANADFPDSLRNDPNRPERLSDHDSPVAYFTLGSPPVRPIGVTNAATFLSGAVAPGEIVSIFGTGFGEGVRPLFDGVAAPVFYSSPNQINTATPPALGSTTVLQVGSVRLTLPVVPSAPGVFGVLNQDYSLNSRDGPAAPGSVLQIFATGGGNQPASVRIDGIEAEVLYAGPAPGLPAGAWQVNARAPAGARSGPVPLVLAAALAASPPAIIYLAFIPPP
jgi:hypothetical protein